MAIISPYISQGAQAGQPVNLKLHLVRWRKVGHGRLKALSEFGLEIEGSIDLPIYHGDLHILIALLDQDVEAGCGPCSPQLNSSIDEKASYVADEVALTISALIDGGEVKIRLSRFNRDNMTKCLVSGALDLTTYIEPL